MRRDPTEFRKRFLAWKDGERVYDAGRVVSYAGGKDAEYWDAVKDFVTRYEGFKDTTYLDGKGVPTIGYGFTDSALTKRGKISRAEADRYLINRLKKEDSALRDTLPNWDKLSTDAKKALISYRYNYPAGFKDTTNFMKHWNAGNYAAAIREVDAGWNDTANPGLRTRRIAELALLSADPFLSGTPAIGQQMPTNASLPPIEPAVADATAINLDLTDKGYPIADNTTWKALNHFKTMDALLDFNNAWDWSKMSTPLLLPVFPLNAKEWLLQSLLNYEGGKDANSGFWNRVDNAADYAEKALAVGGLAAMGATIASPNPYTLTAAAASNIASGTVDAYLGIRAALRGDYGNAGKNAIEMLLSISGAKLLSNAKKLSNLDNTLRTSGAMREYVTHTVGRRQATKHSYKVTKEASKASDYNATGTALSIGANASSMGDLPDKGHHYNGKDAKPKYGDGIVGAIKNAILGASIAEDPAVATAAGWLLIPIGVIQLRDTDTNLLGEALTQLSFFSPTNYGTAAIDAGLKLAVPAAKALGLALKYGPKTATGVLKIPKKVTTTTLPYDASSEDVVKYANSTGGILDYPEYANIGDIWSSNAVKARNAAIRFYREDVLPRAKAVKDFWDRLAGNFYPTDIIYSDRYSKTPNDAYHTYEMFNSPVKVADIGENNIRLGGWNESDGTYLVKLDYPVFAIDDVLIHEGEHAQRRALGSDALLNKNGYSGMYGKVKQFINALTKKGRIDPFAEAYSASERTALNDAYSFTDDYIKQHNPIQITEKGATNRQMRYMLSKQNNGVVGKELDDIIDNLSTTQIKLLMIDANGYGENFVKAIENEISNVAKHEGISLSLARSKVWAIRKKAIKHALKYVPALSGAASIVDTKKTNK